jgi:hypothetical protein
LFRSDSSRSVMVVITHPIYARLATSNWYHQPLVHVVRGMTSRIIDLMTAATTAVQIFRAGGVDSSCQRRGVAKARWSRRCTAKGCRRGACVSVHSLSTSVADCGDYASAIILMARVIVLFVIARPPALVYRAVQAGVTELTEPQGPVDSWRHVPSSSNRGVQRTGCAVVRARTLSKKPNCRAQRQ